MFVVRRRPSWPWRGPLGAPEGPPAAFRAGVQAPRKYGTYSRLKGATFLGTCVLLIVKSLGKTLSRFSGSFWRIGMRSV